MGQKLGQHFLKNKKILQIIAGAAELRDGETVIEVGPGHGELTEHLKSQTSNLKNCKIILIEKDKALAEQLEKKFEKDKNIKIIYGDALKILSRVVSSLSHKSSSLGPSYILVGNIPYYITGYLLRTIQELKNRPTRTIVMIQKEVAERIVKKPPEMNLLAASVAYWADAAIIMSVSKKEFVPQPKIDSAVIALHTKRTHLKNSGGEEKKYYKTLGILFKQPRKTIKNNITLSYRSASKCNTGEKEEIFKRLKKTGIDIEQRSQNLSVEEIRRVANVICTK